jgi:plastocyanin
MRFRMKTLAMPVLVIAAACGGGGTSDSTGGITNPGGGTNPGTNPGTPSTPVSTLAVTVADNQFSPSSIQVATGSTVTWTWASGASTHNVTFNDGVNSGDRSANASYTRTFNSAGTFSYVCTIHAGMQGTVLVK